MDKRDSELWIRDATVIDVVDVARIWRDGLASATGLPTPLEEEAIAGFTARISSPPGKSQFWVAVADGKVVGWQSLTDFGVTQISPIAQSSTYIDSDWHDRGVGRCLLKHAQTIAASLGLQTIVGRIRTDNIASVELVSSLGWRFVGVLPRAVITEPEQAYWAYAVPAKVEPRKHFDDLGLALSAGGAAV
jgi:L-amino acid N-acyltransferase YncA